MTETPHNEPGRHGQEQGESGIEDTRRDEALQRELTDAGTHLRERTRPVDPNRITSRVLHRRTRRLGALAGALAVLAVVLAGALVANRDSSTRQLALGADHVDPARLDAFVSGLPSKPVDPTKVRLVSTVESFRSCDALIGTLRRVGAEHVGSRGFGDVYGGGRFDEVGAAVSDKAAAAGPASSESSTNAGAGGDGPTLGTNVQVSGVDELDHVKAVGSLIYDLDGNGNLRITDATTLAHRSSVAVAEPVNAAKGGGDIADVAASASSLLVAKDRAIVFGSETDTSRPVAGDPSATQSATPYFTVTFVDVTDPDHPKVTDRIKAEGSLVSARLVGSEVRLVTSSNMADIGMVMPTTANSVPIALRSNRRTIATSTAADWIPDWQRQGAKPTPLVPCDRVHVPTTFAGVAMTSMVTFPIDTDTFAPQATSIVAPSTTLYAGLDTVAISSEVWVDPVDRQRLRFDDWQTAIHEFSFPKSGAPTYVGSGIVDGSTIGQFAFGEVGDALAVVTTKGTPWTQNPQAAVDVTLLRPDDKGGLSDVARLEDLADGRGQVSAVRYVPGRILISTGISGRDVQVIDVTDPAKPRRAGKVTLAGTTGYFHPLDHQRALMIESRSDTIVQGDNTIQRPWVRAELLDVSNADAPKVVGSWEVPWSSDEVGWDHHAFTFWPDRNLAMWGTSASRLDADAPNHAVVVDVHSGLVQVAMPEAAKPPAAPAPCPQVNVTEARAQGMIGKDGVVLGCADRSRTEVEWPRYECAMVGDDMIREFAPDLVGDARYFVCHPAPQPTVSRVLVVKGRPILLTDQTLQALDPTTFASTKVVFHPTGGAGAIPIGAVID